MNLMGNIQVPSCCRGLRSHREIGRGKEDQGLMERNKGVVSTQASSSEAVQSSGTPLGTSLDYSHFVSLPLAIHKELVDKLFKFQNSILGNGNSKEEKQVVDNKSSIPIVSYPPKASKSSSLSNLGIDKSIFINPRTFHLTVLMLKLGNKDRVNAAREVLKSISSEVKDALENRPVFINLKGLECMQGSFAKARVLYVPVEEIGNEGRLLRACQVIRDAFIKAGLVLERDARTLKLHATVMNASYRKSQSSKKVDSFDARGIFEEYGSMDWGVYNIRQVHLSQRFVYDKNGYYHCCASMPFP